MKNAEDRINRVLNGLSAAEVPARLEQRIMACVAQRTADPAEAPSSHFAGWPTWVARVSPYAVGAAVAALICAVFVATLSDRAPRAEEPSHLHANVPVTPRAPVARTLTPVLHIETTRQTAAGVTAQKAVAADDPDAIALAETLAPSHPAPPMAVAPQELMTIRSGPSRHSVEMAELQTPHEPGFRTERERTVIRQYILGLLDPLVTAQNLTSSPPPKDDSEALPRTADTPSSN